MSTPETKTITAEVSTQLLDQVDQYAARHHHSRDWALNEALQQWLRAEEEKDGGETAGADAGQADLEVESWDTEYVLPTPKPH